MSHGARALVVRLEPTPERTLRDLLFERGVEFPCGGVSLCGGCRVRVLEGHAPVSAAMREALDASDIAAGWRLGCLAEATGPVTLEIAQWSPSILDDRAPVPFEPGQGIGIVVDVGTTTLVAQAVDRATGHVLAVEAALNPQARFGADVMSRILHERREPGTLTRLIRSSVGALVSRVAPGEADAEVLLVGNTTMHHLFCGLDTEPLAGAPFRTPVPDAREFEAGQLGWHARAARVVFLPCVGGFVGSDVLAGVVATGLADAEVPGALLDLGTNGEIAVGCRSGIRCASTAAGPAFEGGRIGMGMRAGAGAIDRIRVREGVLECHVVGGGPARGLCGSGLVDAVAGALDLGWICPNGRLAPGLPHVALVEPVRITQADIRELQLAKGAIAAGFDLLRGGRPLEPGRIFLAGAFGNYVEAAAARRIGLLPAWAASPTAAGNTALRGARLLLLAGSRRAAILERTLSRCTHVELASAPGFLDAYVERMAFPGA
jgi:uncharacterized 2Fe-2S/4Fe-4S cluster protein (DUF4445 family)